MDPANPLAGCHPERYVLKRLDREDTCFLGLHAEDQTLLDVSLIESAHHFLTHEAALRAAAELNRMGRGPLDVVKVKEPPERAQEQTPESAPESNCDGSEQTSPDSIGSNQQQSAHETPAPADA